MISLRAVKLCLFDTFNAHLLRVAERLRMALTQLYCSITVFYTTPGGLAVQPQPAQVRPIAPQTYQKREKRALKILDPTTMEEVNVLGGKTSTPPQSGSSSSRATPVTANVSVMYEHYVLTFSF